MSMRYKYIFPVYPGIEKRQEVRKWLEEYVGKQLIDWDFKYYKMAFRVAFRFKKDYTLFLLRWQ